MGSTIVSLTSDCNENNGGLKGIYDSLYEYLNYYYPGARRQNVSIRIRLGDLEVDITPARKQSGNTNYHNMYVSKSGTWTQTNTQVHINDISNSGRLNEIKLLKIWRERNQLDFPSIYLEYLLVDNILRNKSKDANKLVDNFMFALKSLAKNSENPLSARVVDPANTNNILSDLLTIAEKNEIIKATRTSIQQCSGYLSRIIY